MPQSEFDREVGETFAYLTELYRRTAELFMEVTGQLEKAGWARFPAGTGINIHGSTSEQITERWFVRHPSLFFMRRGDDQFTRVLCFGVSFVGSSKTFKPSAHGILFEFTRPKERLTRLYSWYEDSACEPVELDFVEEGEEEGFRYKRAKPEDESSNWPDLDQLVLIEVPLSRVDTVDDVRHLVGLLIALGLNGLEGARGTLSS